MKSEAERLSILVIDDDRATSRLIKHNLESNGTQVLEAASGLECVRILCQSKIDLLLLDLVLPDFNGWGILSLLRLTESLHDMPVIVVSVEHPDPVLIKRFSPDDYIQKPFDTRDLIVRVRRVLDSRPSANSWATKSQFKAESESDGALWKSSKKEGRGL
ncbi:MAG: response regulator [Chloroflexota bacterium]